MSLHLRLLTACLISLSALAPYARGDAAALLRAVPQGTSTVVWIRDLRELSDDLDRLAASLTNAAAPPKEVLARALARRVEAGFTSDEELKSLGFDTSQGIAFALERDGSFTAVIRVSDASRAQSRLSRGGPASLTHDGVSYFASPGRSFAFVDDLLVYSTAADGVPRAIDALRGRTPSSRVPSVDSTADVVVLAAREQTAAARTDLLGALGIGDGGRDAASIASSSLGLVGFLSALFGGSQAPQAVLSASVGRDDVRVRVGDGDLPALGTSAWRAMPNDAFAAGSLFVGPGAQGELDAVAKALAAVMPRFAGVPDGSPREIAFAARVRRYLLPEV
ncbi:hypothetical protein FJZ36_10050, partial [Candidatus Poribacteria bacterium]|nr:hypothetical protein [Candidatus Poribacteria bacterium]